MKTVKPHIFDAKYNDVFTLGLYHFSDKCTIGLLKKYNSYTSVSNKKVTHINKVFGENNSNILWRIKYLIRVRIIKDLIREKYLPLN